MQPQKREIDPATALLRQKYGRLKKLKHDRQACGSRWRDAVVAARSEGISPLALRSAWRLYSMPHDDRDSWIADISLAAIACGYNVTAQKSDKRANDNPLRVHLDKLAEIDADKKRVAAATSAEWKEIRKAGLDGEALRACLRMSELDAHERSEWFDRIDMTGKALDFWVEPEND